MIDWDKPIRTKCGRPARVLCKDYRSSASCTNVIVLVDFDGTKDVQAYFRLDGSNLGGFVIENVPEERWVVEWVDEKPPFFTQRTFPSKEKAIKFCCDSYPKSSYKVWKLVEG